MLTSQDLAARFLPLREEERKKILKRLPRRKGERSQLFDSFAGAWYVHRGPLILSDDYDSTLNLVVDGDLTVRGTVDDCAASAPLVVLGDLRCRNLLSRHLTVVTGSLFCGGLIYADGPDHALEIWGEALESRALVLTDKSARLPGRRFLEYFYDDLGETHGDPDVLIPSALRHLDEEGHEFGEADRRAGATVARVRPAAFGDMRALMRRHPDVFNRPFDYRRVTADGGQRVALLQEDCPRAVLEGAIDDPSLQLDLALSPAATATHLSELPGSSDEAVLVALASHPATPVETLEGLAKHTATPVRAAVVHHPKLPEELLARLARDRRTEVRQQVAASPSATPFLPKLGKDPSSDVRRAVASHPDLGDDDRLRLLQDADPTVRRRALRYLPNSRAWVDRLMATDNTDLIAWAIERQVGPGTVRTFSEAAQGLFDPRRTVREAWLARLSQAPELLRFFDRNADRFAADESEVVRRFLAASARDAESLARLAQDPTVTVRRAALDNLAAPEGLLVAEAERLCRVPALRWSVNDPDSMVHIHDVHALLRHPRLPAGAVARIHRVYPLRHRLEPHPNMTLSVILERAQSLRPSLALEPGFQKWKTAAASGEPEAPVYATLLNADDLYLQTAARINASTPLEALLRQARHLEMPGLKDTASSPALALKTPVAASLLQFLLNQDDEEVAFALAGNPHLPLRVLRDAAQRSPAAQERARITAWQAHGEIL